jgi:serine protease
LSNSTNTTIPALQISYINGEKLISKALGTTLTIEEKMGYGYLSGTSMAAPHVTGVIAKIWRIVSTISVNIGSFNL